MRYWIYAEPCCRLSSEPAYMILSDDAIIASYWDCWQERMKQLNKHELINYERCIQDWAVVHWAEPVTPELLQQFCLAPNTP